MDNISLFHLIFGLNGKNSILDYLMISGAESLIYLAIGLSCLLAFRGKVSEKKAFLLTLISFPIMVVIIKSIHIFFFEARPFVTYDILPLISYLHEDASFPSRHASTIAVIAFAYSYYKSKWTPLFLFLMLWIGFSRIFVGVHYPLDILGGFGTGLASVAISIQLKKLLNGLFIQSLKS
ncbi:hypothetical protein A3C59_02280 [Candidatus Daviesbacteria bacterium RIFCSPHIGHO2_02_FULL_36_13]|uniref:Phosphatidic acid phosphatase type 2/haloperoxidase domain-containing protein n=1 Tax=Candidatus Daviesbacteria bacterium RIFCSPHIGHO2_02_FULL_36_13 TaxID=1797768 RepID=A0A1F5JS37_9BACT|nr:MAG: hypothetical protein A3C59_02280 [Candidatus Daviesbacteria bacterium RIFCSPHIGHO2_02_FULL_36_13]